MENCEKLKIPRSIENVIRARAEREETPFTRLRQTAQNLLGEHGKVVPQEGTGRSYYSLVVTLGRKGERPVEVKVATTGFHRIGTDLDRAPIVVIIGCSEGNLQLNPDPANSIFFEGDSRGRSVTMEEAEAYEELLREIGTALGENNMDLVRRSDLTYIGVEFVTP